MAEKKRQIPHQTIFTGDNLDIMRGMDSESIDLIYLDPPFNSNRHYEAPIGSKAAGAEFKDAWTFEDTKAAWWGLIAEEHPALYKVIDAIGEVGNEGDKAYLIYMAMRLLEMRRILKETGSIYLHCDPTMSHSLKMAMDALFGRKNFRNEIAWCYTGPGKTKRWFPRKHDIILFYGASDGAAFRSDSVRVPYKQLNIQHREQQETGIGGKLTSGNIDLYKERGKIPEDWWSDISPVGRIKKERTGYPTQKPLALLRRIILSSSHAGDMVLDPFCGCATACIAAEELSRQWIGIDLSPLAAKLVKQRMKNELDLLTYKDLMHRHDIPRRSDQITKPSRNINHILFGEQEGRCNGCRHSFPFQNFTRDHIIPTDKGGADTDDNLQLLCARCNSIKGSRPMEYLIAQLKKDGTMAR